MKSLIILTILSALIAKGLNLYLYNKIEELEEKYKDLELENAALKLTIHYYENEQ